MTYRALSLVSLLVLGCAVAYVAGPRFHVHVVNRSTETVRIYGMRGGAMPFPIATIQPGETRAVPAMCTDFRSRRTDFRLHTLGRGTSINNPRPDDFLLGEYVGSCSDSLVVEIPMSGPRYATVEVW